MRSVEVSVQKEYGKRYSFLSVNKILLENFHKKCKHVYKLSFVTILLCESVTKYHRFNINVFMAKRRIN